MITNDQSQKPIETSQSNPVTAEIESQNIQSLFDAIKQEIKEVGQENACLPAATTEAELRHKIELQNKQLSLMNQLLKIENEEWRQKGEEREQRISSLLQSMKQEREEIRQKGEESQQKLSLAVSRMEQQLQKNSLFANFNKKKMNETSKPEEISDGYHTLAELYEHRHALCLALMRSIPDHWWMSRRHNDGELCFGSDEWFIVGADLPGGNTITYHLPSTLWDLAIATGATVLERGRSWDGHTPQDVVERLKNYVQFSH